MKNRSGGLQEWTTSMRPFTSHLQREPGGVPQGHRVFTQITKRSARRRAQRIPQDAHAVDHRFALRVLLGSLRADDGDLIACVRQSAAFLPDPPVERHRQVLDEDQDVSRHPFILFAPKLLSAVPRTSALCSGCGIRSRHAPARSCRDWIRSGSSSQAVEADRRSLRHRRQAPQIPARRLHHVANRTAVGRHDRQSGRHRLDQRDRHTFVHRRKACDVQSWTADPVCRGGSRESIVRVSMLELPRQFPQFAFTITATDHHEADLRH